MKKLPVQTPAMARKFLMVVDALAALAWPSEVVAQGVKATLLSIGDGDTIRVRQAGKALTVRLACIDAPETAQSPYGQQARMHLQQRLPIGREVSLSIKTTDRYGRSVAEVFSGVNINLALVEDGQAFAYRHYLSGCDAKAYLEAEERASRARLGI
ncbi:thermonuclease family protein [Cyanobium sp. BA5m-10]|uniref:thermonuclease family protein n=1 Tax=Cyanobium sp. BA5m-10 TaxID=2823705 RepID=UPI0020CE6AAB|nr:thermonuclease family protein [Cyanobium sp. BA5m-10]